MLANVPPRPLADKRTPPSNLGGYDYTLVDSDAAINARLWQQGGHSGVSQWNFVMHPVFAAKNADPTGDYVRRWVPELAAMPTEFIHRPWEAPLELLAIGVRLGSRAHAKVNQSVKY